MFSRRLLREKAFQALYAYAQQRSASIWQLETYTQTQEVSTEEAQALYNLRQDIEAYSRIDDNTYQQLCMRHENECTAYRNFYNKLLGEYQKQAQRDIATALQDYEAAAQQLACDYYLILSLYISLYAYAKEHGGRIGQSPVLAALHGNRSFTSLLRQFKLPPSPPAEVVQACYAALQTQDDKVGSKWHSWEEDSRYLVRISRSKWLQTAALSTWMEEQDPCWHIHKPLLQATLIKNFQACQKDTSYFFAFTRKYANLAEAVVFGRTLCEQAITDYLYWSKELAAKVLHWELQRISLSDRVLLVLALTEIMHMPDVPLRVSMNEYIEIAKAYSSPKSAIFVNGLLEGVLKDIQSPKQQTDKTQNLISYPSTHT